MNKDDEKVILQQQVHVGAEHQRAWETLVEPFFLKKTEELFEFFQETSVESPEKLQYIHNQVKALKSLEDHFKTFIQTGKMAQITIDKQEKTDG